MDESADPVQQLELLSAPDRARTAPGAGEGSAGTGAVGQGSAKGTVAKGAASQGTAKRGAARGGPPVRAEWMPVARVAVDLPLPHLDRPFDYAVPASMEHTALPGTRVRVRFAGQDVEGFVLERCPSSDHSGRLAPLRRLVSEQVVLTDQVLALARAVADRYAGTLVDVLRLAIPARHARGERAACEPASVTATSAAVPAETESVSGSSSDSGQGHEPLDSGQGHEPSDSAQGHDPSDSDQAQTQHQGRPGNQAQPWNQHQGQSQPRSPTQTQGPASDPAGAWDLYPAGRAFLARLASGGSPRAVWSALPGPSWTWAIAAAVRATVDSGRGALVVVPDHADLEALAPAMDAVLGAEGYARLEAGQGPQARYTAFVSLCRGTTRVAVGTRAAAFAPVENLGLVVIWEDGDDAHVEQRSPHPHTRQVLLIRAEQDGAAALLGGWSRTAEAAALLESGWAREIQAPRPVRRRLWPRIVVPDAERSGPIDPAGARLPTPAWKAIRDGLTAGPVLAQVPRAGYVPVTRCQGCRRPARCTHCAGPVRVARSGGAGCTWCGRPAPGWTCPTCGDRRLRAAVVGVDRTAEELGRAFPSVPLVISRPAHRPSRVPPNALVLATPGVEPAVPGGYAAAVLLDGDRLLARPDLRVGEQALARWLGACALVRPADRGGRVVLCADPQADAVRALVRADPGGHAAAELAERTELGLPPAVGCATVTGEPAAVTALLDLARLPEQTQILGPVPLPEHLTTDAAWHADGAAACDEPPVRALLRVPTPLTRQLAKALADAVAVRSARRDPGTARVRLDPLDLG